MTKFLSDRFILSLVLNVKIHTKNKIVCVASLLSLSGHFFHTICMLFD